MRSIHYLDFDLLIERGEEPGTYEARVLGAPSGEYEPVEFRAPFSDLELENFLLKIGRRRTTVRGLDVQETATVKDFGSQLFERVFTGTLQLALATSLSETDSDDLGLRMRLRLTDCPELADIPWEYMYDKTTRRFLALSEWTPVVRYLDLPGRVRQVAVHGPLRILGMAASPSDYPQLSVGDEWAKLHTALDGLIRTGRVDLTVIPDGTLAALHRELRRNDYHVFHYIGHGGFLPGAGDGVLILEDAHGRGLEVTGQDLGVSLHDHRTLRLAILNSCEGARAGITDPYAGTAQTLVQQGIPAVVAMQFEITDDAAITFSQVLYEAIADGYPLDAAMAEARKAVRNQPNPTEWGTPVLYLRAPDGRVFDMTQATPKPAPGTLPTVDESVRSVEEVEASPDDDTSHPIPPGGTEKSPPAPGDGAQETKEPVEPLASRPMAAGVPPTVTTDHAPGDTEQHATRDPATVPATANRSGGVPPTETAPASPVGVPPAPPGDDGGARRRWPIVVAAAAVLVVVAGLVGYLLNRDDTSAAPSTEDELVERASPYFDSDECETADESNAPFVSQLPTTLAITCGNEGEDLGAVYWCTDTTENFNANRGNFLAEAEQEPATVSGSPAGWPPTDGVQFSYPHVGGSGARVYWDSPEQLCGAVLQTTNTDIAALEDLWRSGG